MSSIKKENSGSYQQPPERPEDIALRRPTVKEKSIDNSHNTAYNYQHNKHPKTYLQGKESSFSEHMKGSSLLVPISKL
jgi:hypothetical protein